MSKMRINKISKIIILYLLSFKINAKELVLAPYEAVIESSDGGLFLLLILFLVLMTRSLILLLLL